MDRFTVALPNGRSLELSLDQVQRIARGLGDDQYADQGPGKRYEPAIVAALRSFPAKERAQALGVALLRFGEKADVETISQRCDLNPWVVWRLEEQFRQAVVESQAERPILSSEIAGLSTR